MPPSPVRDPKQIPEQYHDNQAIDGKWSPPSQNGYGGLLPQNREGNLFARTLKRRGPGRPRVRPENYHFYKTQVLQQQNQAYSSSPMTLANNLLNPQNSNANEVENGKAQHAVNGGVNHSASMHNQILPSTQMRMAMLHFMKTGNFMPEMRHIFFLGGSHLQSSTTQQTNSDSQTVGVCGSHRTTGRDLAEEVKQRLKICIDEYCKGGPQERDL